MHGRRTQTRFGDRVSLILTHRSIARKELAWHLDVSTHRLSHWLRGVSEPSLFHARVIAAYLDIPIDALVASTEEEYWRAVSWHRSKRSLLAIAARCQEENL